MKQTRPSGAGFVRLGESSDRTLPEQQLQELILVTRYRVRPDHARLLAEHVYPREPRR